MKCLSEIIQFNGIVLRMRGRTISAFLVTPASISIKLTAKSHAIAVTGM